MCRATVARGVIVVARGCVREKQQKKTEKYQNIASVV
jgi:hypothetical protein